jgi:hypothetical protein
MSYDLCAGGSHLKGRIAATAVTDGPHGTFSMRSIVVSSNIDAAAREALQGCEPIAFVAKRFRPTELDGAVRNYRHYYRQMKRGYRNAISLRSPQF